MICYHSTLYIYLSLIQVPLGHCEYFGFGEKTKKKKNENDFLVIIQHVIQWHKMWQVV